MRVIYLAMSWGRLLGVCRLFVIELIVLAIFRIGNKLYVRIFLFS